MSSQCIVPDWNLSRQRQVQVQTTDRLQEEEEERRFPHVHNQIHQIPNNVPNFGTLPNYGVAELTWENGHPTTHGLGGPHHSGPTKPTWVRTNGTLESIVHQASYHNKHNLMNYPYQEDHQINPTSKIPVAATSSGYHVQSEPARSRKRQWSDSNMFTTSLDGARGVYGDHGACGSASATFCRDHTNDTNTMACGSFASPPSLKAKTIDEDSDCAGASKQNNPKQNEDREVTTGSHSSKRTRVAAVHNLSERKRRDRINQKMRALQKLVPNANKTDKSSMLDEAISYLKQLQGQVHLMSGASPLGMQQQQFQQQQIQMQQQYLQMSLLAARMGMNSNMFGMSNLSRGLPSCLPPFFHPTMAVAAAAATPTTFMPPLMVPPHIHVRPNQERPTTSCPVSLPDPYRALLAQSMNMDLYSKMATLWGQQINQATTNTSSKSNLQDD